MAYLPGRWQLQRVHQVVQLNKPMPFCPIHGSLKDAQYVTATPQSMRAGTGTEARPCPPPLLPPPTDVICICPRLTGRYGMWIYPIGDSYSADQECQDWYRRNEPLKEERLSGFQRLPECPCSWWWLWGNWRWAYWRDGYNVMCFRMTVGRSRQLAPYGKVGGQCYTT